MAMEALLDATRDTLRRLLDLQPSECDVCPDGKPNPGAGQRFVSVWAGSVTNQQSHALDEYFGLKVTATIRTSQEPRDRKRDGGVWVLCRRIIAAVHMSYDLLTTARNSDATANFVEPLRFENWTYLGPKGPDWFWADGAEDDPTGIAAEISFGKARLITYIGEEST